MSIVVPNNNPYVVAKETAQANALDLDVKTLQIEDAELTKTLAALPAGHPSIAKLNVRHAAIQTNIANKDK